MLTLLGAIVILIAALAIQAEKQHVPVEVLLCRWWEHGRIIVARHPAQNAAALETLLWMGLLLPMFDHALHPWNGLTARLIWYLAIAPHEIGHLICIPAGRFLMVAGGSFWQVFFWLGLGLYTIRIRRQMRFGLLLIYVAGHSLLNLAVYIGDAQERDLPLLFGLGEDSHDWYNLLRWLGLLRYDTLIAGIVAVCGVLLIILVIGIAIRQVWRLSTPA